MRDDDELLVVAGQLLKRGMDFAAAEEMARTMPEGEFRALENEAKLDAIRTFEPWKDPHNTGENFDPLDFDYVARSWR
jgi:hypothetical protein